jgi:hypothetical protein
MLYPAYRTRNVSHDVLITRTQRARTALLLMNCIAIVGYAAFPLMPPRLVPDCDTRFGGCDRGYAFVDTMDTLGGIWSWRGSALEGVSIQSFICPCMLKWRPGLRTCFHPATSQQCCIPAYALLNGPMTCSNGIIPCYLHG